MKITYDILKRNNEEYFLNFYLDNTGEYEVNLSEEQENKLFVEKEKITVNGFEFDINYLENFNLKQEISRLKEINQNQRLYLDTLLMKLVKISPEFSDVEKDGIDLILKDINEAQELTLELNNINIIKENINAIEWKSGIEYTVNQHVKYNNSIYKVMLTHTSQPNWCPKYAHALFTLIATEKDIEDIGTGKCPDFVQPMANTTYQLGDCVTFNGKQYKSLINGNAWSPSAYPQGWEEQ